MVTFYSQFALNPTGKYRVSVCLGTACYVKGAQTILDELEKQLGIKAGGTTAGRPVYAGGHALPGVLRAWRRS